MINKAILAIYNFYSRIILNRIAFNKKKELRKLGKILKNYTKFKADLQFLNFCLDNQLLPKCVNFKLYDVTAHHEKSTINYKRKLLTREIEKKRRELSISQSEFGRLVIQFRCQLRGLHFYSSIHYLSRSTKQYECDVVTCLLYTSPSPRDKRQSRMPSSA